MKKVSTTKALRLAKFCSACARGLREFGYPSVNAGQVREIWDAYEAGKRGSDLPHGVIGLFVEKDIKEHGGFVKG